MGFGSIVDLPELDQTISTGTKEVQASFFMSTVLINHGQAVDTFAMGHFFWVSEYKGYFLFVLIALSLSLIVAATHTTLRGRSSV